MAKRPSVTEQARRLTKGQINRRRFIMSAVASGVTLPTATALASRAEARVPQAGGTLRIATAGRPGDDAGAFEKFLALARGNTLTRVTGEGRVVGDLAASVAVSDDHRVWRFVLRDGVRFQNGAPLRADTLIAAFRTDGMTCCEATANDARTVTLRFDLPAPDLGEALARPDRVIRHAGDGSTTGGYRVERLDGDRVCLVRDADYWKPNAAHFDAVEMRSIPDAAARHRAVMNGEVDYADEIDPQAIATLRGLGTLAIFETVGTHHLAFPMRRDTPPFDDPRVRDALAAAIDGRPVLQAAALGRGAVAAHGSHGGLDVPGASLGLIPLHVSDAAIPGSLAAARIVERQADLAGITVRIEDVSATSWPHVRERAGWYVSKGPGAPEADAIPHLRLNAIAAHSTALAHPGSVSERVENDGYRIADRWWFAAPTRA